MVTAAGSASSSCFLKNFRPTMFKGCVFWLPRDYIPSITFNNAGQLIQDGDCDDPGVSAWSVGNNADLSKELDGNNRYLKIAYSTTANPFAHQLTGVMVTNREYHIAGKASGNGSIFPRISGIVAATTSWTGTISTDWQYFDFIETATGATPRINLVTNNGSSSSDWTRWDDIVVEETTPRVIEYRDPRDDSGLFIKQQTSTKQPNFHFSGGFNDHSFLRFDGIDDALKGTYTLDQPFTRVLVCKPSRSDDTTGTVADGGSLSSTIAYLVGADTFGINAGTLLQQASVESTNWHYLLLEYNGASSKIYVDGGTPTIGNAGTNNSGGLTLGARGNETTDPGDCDVAEVVDYSRILSDTEKDILFSYLAA
jgi:hypothetical protein